MNRAWMRDPLRAGMEARVRGTQRLALGAALTLAFGLLVNLALRRKIRAIDMAQALKSIE
mgnify:FL=1